MKIPSLGPKGLRKVHQDTWISIWSTDTCHEYRSSNIEQISWIFRLGVHFWRYTSILACTKITCYLDLKNMTNFLSNELYYSSVTQKLVSDTQNKFSPPSNRILLQNFENFPFFQKNRIFFGNFFFFSIIFFFCSYHDKHVTIIENTFPGSQRAPESPPGYVDKYLEY